MMNRIRSTLALIALLAFASLAGAQAIRSQGAITAQNTVSAGTCSAGGCVEIDVSNRGSLSAHVTGTYTGALSGQVTTDGVAWITLGSSGTFTNLNSGAASATISSGSTGVFRVSGAVGVLKFRLTGLSAMTGTATVTLQTSPVTPESSTSISGGAGDASAANQVTGNNSLSSIDGKLPSLASGRVPVTDASVVAQGSTTSGQSVTLGGAAVTTAAPTYTTGQTAPLSVDTSGALRITGSISAGGVAQGSTTSGQTGGLTQAAVTTSAPSYTNGQTSPLSMDTSGQLRITGTVSAGGVAQGSTTSGQTGGLIQAAVTTSAPSYTNAQTSPLSLDTAGNLRVAVTGGAGSTVSGSTAHDAAGSAVNPVAMGCYSSAAAPTAVSADTDVTRAWCLRNGAQAVQQTFAGTLASTASGAADGGTQRTISATDDPIIAAINGTNSQLPAALGTAAISGSLSVTPATSSSWPVSGTVSITSNSAVNVAQINGVTPLMGAGNTGTGSHRTTQATDQAALPAWGLGAVGSAAPAGAQMLGARSGANMVAVSQGSATLAIDTSSSGTAQQIALSSGQVIHVTSLSVMAAGTTTVRFVYGTGTNCGTGTTNLTGAYPLVANAGLTLGNGLGPVLVVPAGNALCLANGSAIDVDGHITYTQFTP